METRRLYYEDCHLYSFSASVTGCEPVEGGYAVTLDATAFYPEGGGQACDLGRLNDVHVLDVADQDGVIIHLCDQPLQIGQQVAGAIDVERRFDLMQQHTGEHIVSGIVNRRYGWNNVGFHIGADGITIDFDGPIPADDLADIEAQANAALWQNLPVKCWTPSPEELPGIYYRSKKQLQWPVRIVEVPGIDSCACCGVHVAYTGEVGLIKLFSCVKFHQGVRIEMACGKRAMDALNAVFDQNRQVSQAFSANIYSTGQAARKMNERLTAVEYRCSELERMIWDSVAKQYTGRGDVFHYDPSLTPTGVRELAERIARCCDGVAAVLGGSDHLNLCMINSAGDVKALSEAVRSRLEGRGGGKPSIFQGTVGVSADRVAQFFADWYSSSNVPN